ncbi:hypothetical protein E8P82_12355 [Arthrobacter echini]|uniref:Uncharacterized protein n=1 Tax=Arthrobacter echini TaxID=1529066 RepID=A0A4S5E2B7_9MICC|nr:hypothetical protein [Arthrobacter echini]THJ65525.1 hypothetical protein E8P82_12355 [Arthrobacter echini]
MDDALRNNGFLATRRAITGAVQSAVTDDYKDVASELAGMLMAFARLGYDDGTDPSIKTFSRMSTASNLKLTDAARANLRDRLVRFITIPNLILAARAAYVERDHERLLTESNIRTDIRPQLSKNGIAQVVVPWHSLRFQYAVQNQEKEESQTIVLDHQDLVILREQIDEALNAQRKIQEQMQSASIEVWDPYTPQNFEGSAEK